MLKADFVWRRERLIVETDGYRFHGGRHAFERDRRRDQLLVAAGWRVIRITGVSSPPSRSSSEPCCARC